MKILVTGTYTGIGKATAMKFLAEGHEVHGIDIKSTSIEHSKYAHHIADVSNPSELPDIADVDVLVNNAGTDYEPAVMAVNAMGYFYVAEKYAVRNFNIKALVNVCSISATSGIEPPLYVMSQGARLAYTRNLALRLSHRGVLVNGIIPAGVYTPLNDWLIGDSELMQKVINETLLKKWSDPSEAADLIYFLTVVNKSIQGQFIPIDNGESAHCNFIYDEAMGRKFFRGARVDIPMPTDADLNLHVETQGRGDAGVFTGGHYEVACWSCGKVYEAPTYYSACPSCHAVVEAGPRDKLVSKDGKTITSVIDVVHSSKQEDV